MQDLNISMHAQVPKRHLRSNVKTYIYAGCVVLLALVVFRLWITRDTVSNFHSDETNISIQVFKNVGSTELLSQNLGAAAILGPLTLDDAIELSNREFALHFNNLGQISEISIDNELGEHKLAQFDQIGLSSIEINGRTLISTDTIENNQNPNTRLTFHALNPFFDGKIRSIDQNGWLSVHSKGLTLHGLGAKAQIKTELQIPEQTDVIAQITSTEKEQETTNTLSSYLSEPMSEIINSLSSPWKLVVTQDTDKNIFYSLLIEENFEIDVLAEIARNLNSISSLSTIALTLDDKSTVSEIRSVYEPEISIATEQDTHFLHLSSGDTELHMTQTPSYLLTTNHNTSPSLDNIQVTSQCKPNAHTFVIIESVTDNTLGSSVLSKLDTIAINNRSIYLCW
ncbi:hypothetical protein HN358_03080 [Candidatus Uhrbacteria bacterium]|jgi:hypothetical protein|nr:hypothetical protein [Candidatus Uhrbacteria bacterium]MBT7717184.1 hypothetical protein [Candidatus Uhrbacteria bacterium]